MRLESRLVRWPFMTQRSWPRTTVHWTDGPQDDMSTQRNGETTDGHRIQRLGDGLLRRRTPWLSNRTLYLVCRPQVTDGFVSADRLDTTPSCPYRDVSLRFARRRPVGHRTSRTGTDGASHRTQIGAASARTNWNRTGTPPTAARSVARMIRRLLACAATSRAPARGAVDISAILQHACTVRRGSPARRTTWASLWDGHHIACVTKSLKLRRRPINPQALLRPDLRAGEDARRAAFGGGRAIPARSAAERAGCGQIRCSREQSSVVYPVWAQTEDHEGSTAIRLIRALGERQATDRNRLLLRWQ